MTLRYLTFSFDMINNYILEDWNLRRFELLDPNFFFKILWKSLFREITKCRLDEDSWH